MSRILAAMALGVLILVAGVMIGPTVTDLSTDNQDTTFVGVNESVELNSDLQASVTGVNTTGNKTSTIELYDKETRQRVAQTLNESERTNVTIRGETLNMTAQNITSDTVRLNSEYPTTYGWDSPAKTAANQLPFILATAGALIVLASIGVMVDP